MPFRWSDFPVQIVHCVTGSDDFKAEVSFLLLRASSIAELFHQQHWLTPFISLSSKLNREETADGKGRFCLSDRPIDWYKLYVILQDLMTSRQVFPLLPFRTYV